MGGVAVLHPQDCLNDNRDNLFLTPVKSRRNPKSTPNLSTSNPNLSRSDGRKRSPPTGVRKHKLTAATVTDPTVMAGKSLVMGQVKILKRGEPLDDLSTVLKDTNDRNGSNAMAETRLQVKDVSGDRKAYRGSESSMILKDVKDVKDTNDRKVTNAAATTTMTSRLTEKVVSGDRKVNRDNAGDRKVTPVKKKSEKEKRSFANPRIEGLKIDDFALSSTDRLGPDPEMVPKQMNKNIADFFFAGSAFVDSPPPSSLPLPGFFTKSFAAVKEDPSTDLRRLLGLSPF